MSSAPLVSITPSIAARLKVAGPSLPALPVNVPTNTMSLLLPSVLASRSSPATFGPLPPVNPSSSTRAVRSEEHTPELQSLMRTSYADICLTTNTKHAHTEHHDPSPV